MLQTRIVSQAEVRRSIEDLRPSIEKELSSLFETKGALRKITEAEVKTLRDENRAELIPSKLVFSVKPDQMSKGGKKKTPTGRLVEIPQIEKMGKTFLPVVATAVALRAALTVAAQFGFEGSVMDVRTAFLNAPIWSCQVRKAKMEKSWKQRGYHSSPCSSYFGWMSET